MLALCKYIYARDVSDAVEPGDAPDTFDDRLEAITRLIDAIDDELDALRRRRRAALAMRLLAHLAVEANRRVVIQLDRLEFE